jgi:hypothetical protein
MDQIMEHEAMASELEAILNDAPYPTLDELKRRVDGARARYSHGFNPGYEHEKLAGATESMKRFLTTRGVGDTQKRQFVMQDIAKIRGLKNFRNAQHID